MNTVDLDYLYKVRQFKIGHSRMADQAMLNLLKVLRPADGKVGGEDFYQAWQKFLSIILAEMPNVSFFNLVALESPLSAQRRHTEKLIIRRIVVELCPDSTENQCFLGHAYRNVGDYQSAIECYRKAYDRATQLIGERGLEETNPMCLDAIDYLCHIAEAENKLGRSVEAFMTASRALSMLSIADAAWKSDRVYDVLYRVCLGMDLDDLAEHYRSEAKKARDKNPLA